MKITYDNLGRAECAIEELSASLGITEKEIVAILRQGMEDRSPISGQLSETNKYFLDEMESTFDCY